MEEDLKLCTVQFTLSELLTEEDGVRAYQGSQGFMIFFFFSEGVLSHFGKYSPFFAYSKYEATGRLA